MSGRQRILWVSPNLPNPDQDGSDLRRWQMITTLSRRRATVTLWSDKGHDAGRYGPVLAEAGISWVAPPPTSRSQGAAGSNGSGLRALVRSESWDAIVLSYSYLAARHLQTIRRDAPGAPIVVDLGNARFHEPPASEPAGEHANADELEIYRLADGLITASVTDTEVLLRALPGLPGYTFAPLAPQPAASTAAADEGPLVFWGNMAHHANANAVGWWMEEIAGEVSQRYRAALSLQLRGPGAGVYKSVWGASDKLEVDSTLDSVDGARVVLLPLRHSSETAVTALNAASKGIPIVATSAAIAGIASTMQPHISLGETAEQLAELVVELMTNDEVWQRRSDQLLTAAGSAAKHRGALEREFSDWMARRRPIGSVAHSEAS